MGQFLVSCKSGHILRCHHTTVFSSLAWPDHLFPFVLGWKKAVWLHKTMYLVAETLFKALALL